MPLSLDEIQIVSAQSDFDTAKNSFFSKLGYRFTRFMYSFAKDYDSMSGVSADGESITVWVNWGRDQSSALDMMIKQDFTEKYGIGVNLKIVSATLINGLMAGQYPDVQLSMTRSDPVNFGIRGALYNLKKFEDYSDILTRFREGAEQPYCYQDACYALPETQTFYVMFYRTDILSKLGLSVPYTWDSFIKTAAVIQRNNMEVYIPYTQITNATAVNHGIGSMSLFPTLMSQAGLPLYNETLTASALDNVDAINVFDTWTKMYTDYKFVKESDFYNRFRMGIMPLGIAPYSTYFNFVEMAPEIQGNWYIALVPGTVNGGSTVAGGGTGCAIINKSLHKDAAWKFLKWYTSADTQTEYSRRVESVLGLVGRIATSNIEALSRMEWNAGQLAVLNEQWSRVSEVPEIPGSYYLIRSVDQAYWSVINGEMNSMDAIAQWNRSANAEIERKYREYGAARLEYPR